MTDVEELRALANLLEQDDLHPKAGSRSLRHIADNLERNEKSVITQKEILGLIDSYRKYLESLYKLKA